jgi:7-keto-8-aminopelargonate synthetase-like enzyme
VSAATKLLGFVERMRPRYLAARRAPDPPALLPSGPSEELADKLRADARGLVSGLATLSHELWSARELVAALRYENRRLQGDVNRAHDELQRETHALTCAQTVLCAQAQHLNELAEALEQGGIYVVQPMVPELRRVADAMRAEAVGGVDP